MKFLSPSAKFAPGSVVFPVYQYADSVAVTPSIMAHQALI